MRDASCRLEVQLVPPRGLVRFPLGSQRHGSRSRRATLPCEHDVCGIDDGLKSTATLALGRCPRRRLQSLIVQPHREDETTIEDGRRRYRELVAPANSEFKPVLERERTEYHPGGQKELGVALSQAVRPPCEVEPEFRPHVFPNLILGHQVRENGLAEILRRLVSRQGKLCAHLQLDIQRAPSFAKHESSVENVGSGGEPLAASGCYVLQVACERIVPLLFICAPKTVPHQGRPVA